MVDREPCAPAAEPPPRAGVQNGVLAPLLRRLALLLLALPLVGAVLPEAAASAWATLALTGLAPALIVAIVAVGPGREAPWRERLAAAGSCLLAAAVTTAILVMQAYNTGVPRDPAAVAQLESGLLVAALVGRSLGAKSGALALPLLLAAAVAGAQAGWHGQASLRGFREGTTWLASALLVQWLLGLVSRRCAGLRVQGGLLALLLGVLLLDLPRNARWIVADLLAHVAPDRVQRLDSTADGETVLLVEARGVMRGRAVVRHDGRDDAVPAWSVWRGELGPHGAYALLTIERPFGRDVAPLVRFADGRTNACPDVESIGITWRSDGRALFYGSDHQFSLDDGACTPLDGADDVAFLGEHVVWCSGAHVFVDGVERGQLDAETRTDAWLLAGETGVLAIARVRGPFLRTVVARVTEAGLVPLLDAEADRVRAWDGAVCVGDPVEWTCWSPDRDTPTRRTGDAGIDFPLLWRRPTPEWGPLRADGHRRDLRTLGYYDLAPDGTVTAWRWGLPEDQPVAFAGELPMFDSEDDLAYF